MILKEIKRGTILKEINEGTILKEIKEGTILKEIKEGTILKDIKDALPVVLNDPVCWSHASTALSLRSARRLW